MPETVNEDFDPEKLVEQIQTAQRQAQEVDARVKLECVGKLLNNPKRALVGLASRALTTGIGDGDD